MLQAKPGRSGTAGIKFTKPGVRPLAELCIRSNLPRRSIISSRSSLNFSSLSPEVELLEAVEFSLVEFESEADAATPEFSVIQSSKCDTAVKQ